ncbi:MAG: TIGR01906 family membrane protein [Aristaeellaceae bacterium]
MKKRILCIVNLLWWMCFALLFISGAVLDIGTDADLYYKEQTRAGVLETAGVSEEDLWRLDERLAICLLGEENWNDDWGWYGAGKPLRVTVDGAEQDAFNAREIQHMEDCQHLFDLLRTVRWVVLVALILLWVIQFVLERKTREKVSSLTLIWIGSLILIVPLAIFGVWAAIDFNSAFNFFHRLLFTNDLWLLNPETDLLIRICPSSMFESMGLRIALRAAVILLGVPLLMTILKWISDRVRKRKTNETVAP